MRVGKWRQRSPVCPSGTDKETVPLQAPEQFQAMLAAAELLGAEIDHVRVDLYLHAGRIVFSELTPYDGSGHSYMYDLDEAFADCPSHRLDYELGKSWELPNIAWYKRLWHLVLPLRFSG